MKIKQGVYKIAMNVIDTFVKKEYLYNLETGHGEFVKGTIIFINSYPGHQPTFDLLLEDGSVFCYLPVMALSSCETNMCKEDPLPCLKTCLSENFIMFENKELENKICQVFDEAKKWYSFGSLIVTLEWPNENQLLHLVVLDSGQYAIIENSKILFTDKKVKVTQLPNVKKLRQEWK